MARSSKLWDIHDYDNLPLHRGDLGKQMRRIQMSDQKEKFEPDYEGKCDLCEQSPTVVINCDDGGRIKSNLCGPCYFGTANAIYPEDWEECVC